MKFQMHEPLDSFPEATEPFETPFLMKITIRDKKKDLFKEQLNKN